MLQLNTRFYKITTPPACIMRCKSIHRDLAQFHTQARRSGGMPALKKIKVRWSEIASEVMFGYSSYWSNRTRLMEINISQLGALFLWRNVLWVGWKAWLNMVPHEHCIYEVGHHSHAGISGEWTYYVHGLLLLRIQKHIPAVTGLSIQTWHFTDLHHKQVVWCLWCS